MAQILSENDLKLKFSSLKKQLGEKYMYQYKFDDKFSKKVAGMMEAPQKNDDLSIQYKKPSFEAQNNTVGENLSSREESQIDKIFDFKNLFS